MTAQFVFGVIILYLVVHVLSLRCRQQSILLPGRHLLGIQLLCKRLLKSAYKCV